MNVQINVIRPALKEQSRQSIVIPLRLGENVGEIKAKIASKLLVDDVDAIRLLFAGQYLNNDQSIDIFDLGPATALNAILVEERLSPSSSSSTGKTVAEPISDRTLDEYRSIETPREWRSRFFVFCKTNCQTWEAGKLRVRCSLCRSGAVEALREPNCWNDVLTRSSISCRCLDNSDQHQSGEECPLEFYFKCVHCSDENGAVPLPQLRRTDAGGLWSECLTCSIDADDQDEDKLRNMRLVFSCMTHAICMNCFVAYSTETLDRRGFVMSPNGYALPCPSPRCLDGCIADPHHYRLLGDELYAKYHRLAAEMYLLAENGVYCPTPDCGEALIPDDDTKSSTNRSTILCPKCGGTFCYVCRQNAVDCLCRTTGLSTTIGGSDGSVALPAEAKSGGPSMSADMRSRTTIKYTTKPCPKCRAPTEKNEGCNHMTCAQCKFDWCWDCQNRWTEECQWNHWFE